MIARGNHKSSSFTENEETLLSNYTKEVERGWMLPVTLESVQDKGSRSNPRRSGNTIINQRERQQKNKMTYNTRRLFPTSISTICQQHNILGTLTNCFYGHCHICILHITHIMRYKHTQLRIFICKLDL